MTEAKSWQEMIDWCGRLLVHRTGADVAEWNRRIRATGISGEAELRDWLAERGVTGYAQMLLVMERFGYPEFLLASADELVAGQYADRAELRPILDRILVMAPTVGEVQVQARKTYVSLVTPRRQFAVVKPTTRRRVDLGLRLVGHAPVGRLEVARGLANESITLRIALHAPEEVDDVVLGWLRRSYAQNA